MKPRYLKALGLMAFAAVWALTLARVFSHFAPGSVQATGWNSDSAIAVLQSNDPVFDTFRLYYYGQDRTGAWPWLLAQAWRALTGFDWTPYRVFLWQATWVFGGCFALWRFHRQAGVLLAATFATLALLSPLFQVQLFALSQPFGWQLTALFLAWVTLSRFLESLADPVPARGKVWRWGLAAAVFCAQACWTSPTSGPLLLAGVGVEGLRHALALPSWRKRGLLLLGLVPLAVGIGFEARVKYLYHRFSQRHFGHAYATQLEVDRGHLLENVRAISGRILEHPLAPLLVFGLVAALVALGVILSRLRSKSLACEGPEAGLAFLTVGLVGAALANVAITVLVIHVRFNGYSLRYLTPTFALGVLAAASGGLFLLQLVPALRERVGGIAVLLSLVLMAVAHVRLEPRIPLPDVERTQKAADAIVARAGEAILLGGYWDTYRLGALDPSRRLKPVCTHGEYLRTPFWVPELQESKEVLVAFAEGTSAGTAEHPNPWLLQYGTPFELMEARWAVLEPFVIARYRNVRERMTPVRLEPAEGFNPCAPGATLTVTFSRPVEQGLLLVNTDAPAAVAEVNAEEGTAVRLEALPGLWLLHLRAESRPVSHVSLRIRPEPRAEDCGYRGVALVSASPGSEPR